MRSAKRYTLNAVLLLTTISGLNATCGLSPVFAQNATNLLGNSDFMNGTNGWTVPRTTDRARPNITDAVAGPYRRALQIEVTPRQGDLPSAVRVAQPLPVSIQKGDALTLRFWARSENRQRIKAAVEEDAPPHTRPLENTLILSEQWKEYELRGTSGEDYAATGLRAVFELATGPGVVELTGVRCLRNEGGPLQMPALPTSQRTTAVKLVRPVEQPAATPQAPAPILAPQVFTPSPPQPTPSVSLVANGDFTGPTQTTWMLYGPYNPRAEVLGTGVGQFQKSVGIVTTAAGKSGTAEGAILASRRLDKPVATGEVIGVRLWARSAQHCRARIIVQQADAPNEKTMLREVRLTPEWKEYRFFARSMRDFAPGTANFEMHLGLDAGTMQITGIRVENFGKESVTNLETRLGPQTF